MYLDESSGFPHIYIMFQLVYIFPGAKATIRDYSGRLPVSYLPDTDAGRRLKSKLSQVPLLSSSESRHT